LSTRLAAKRVVRQEKCQSLLKRNANRQNCDCMKINMDDSRLTNIVQLREFLKASQGMAVSLGGATLEEKYAFIDDTIDRLDYRTLSKKDKKTIINYLRKVTGYKHTQLFRLIKRAGNGKLSKIPYQRINPHRIYTSRDIKLLEKTDELHLRLSDMATKEILRREYEVFGHLDFQTITRISHSHIDNLRDSPIYKNSWINHTKARLIPIGITMPPDNLGKPGSIRVDAVHQNEVYHLNSVDEIIQWEIAICVPQICEACMVPAIEEMIDQYPFTIFNFHSDRGGETINYQVADLLQRLLIKQTKSRSNHCNDNALVETKNGSVIRKNMGWQHINQSLADKVNDYYRNFFNPYLNYHRPCGFPTIVVDDKGKKRKVYKTYQVPYEALKKIPNADKYLKPGITFDRLDTIAYQCSDNEFAQIMRNEERKLFEIIMKTDHKAGLLYRY